MDNSTILVVDDEKEIMRLVSTYLVNDGFEVKQALSGMECLTWLSKEPNIHLVILDVMMPDMDGFEVLRQIRLKSRIPVIMLTARTEDIDKLSGFEIGADDYVTKPFNPLELLARVKSQLKRYEILEKPGEEKPVIAVAGLIINEEKRTVLKNDNIIPLTKIEFEILLLLAKSPGRVFSADEIFAHVWKDKYYDGTNTVMVHIRRLRMKLENESVDSKIIKTVWGVGYKLEGKTN